MDVHARLIAIVASATSPASALDSAADAIAATFAAEACTIFFQRKRTFEARARSGPPPAAIVADAEKVLAESAMVEVLPKESAAEGVAVLAVPVASINEIIGAIVLRRSAELPFTTEETMRLAGAASQLGMLVASARVVETIDNAGIEVRRVETGSDYPPPIGETVLKGIAASPGIALGHASFRHAFPRIVTEREAPFRGASEERALVDQAIDRTRADLVRVQAAAASEIGEEQALIFGAHLLLLGDPMLTGLVDVAIASGRTAALSLEDAFDEIRRRLEAASDPLIRERVEDVDDLRSRLLGQLVGQGAEGSIAASLVVSLRTTPSLVVELKAAGACGIASEVGGATTHGVLLARALGIPAVTGVEALTHQVAGGDLVIVDGDAGVVVLRPSAETRVRYEEAARALEERRADLMRFRGQPAVTADGTRVVVQANIALGADLVTARENGADGVGLYRTEFPFIVRDTLPSVDEQVRIYVRAFDAFPDGPLSFRILDLAGDKFVASRELGTSRNAFHGYRSIRILFDHPHVLRDQVQAFAIAAAGRELRVLIPMVTSVDDVVRIKALAAASLARLPAGTARGPVRFGAMLETPAAIELVTELAAEVDFFSIGTNDLVQYTLIIDREDPRMASEEDAYHPAILRMIRRAVLAAHAAGRPVGVCGEMAARPELAIALLALGVDSLSVVPSAIPDLKQALGSIALAPLQRAVDALLALPRSTAVQSALRGYVRDASLVPGRA
jgi:phosphoenolpyruvate-protein phosphotransferase